MKFKTLAWMLALWMASAAAADPETRIALILGKTGPLEAYAKQTETGFMLGLEYLTGGKMELDGHKLKVLVKDDQLKPDLAKAALAEAYGDDKVAIAVGTTSSGATLAMLPVAEEYRKVLIVEPAVADSITGEKWNRYVFRTSRNSTQDGLAGAATLMGEASVAFLAQDYAFGRDGVKAAKEALAAMGSKAKIVHEEYAPQNTTDFTAPVQRIFDALKSKPAPRILAIVWAGTHPLGKIADLKPERYGIALAPGGNILPVLKTWRHYAGTEGAISYYYGFPKNPMNDWLVKEHFKRYKAPPDMFTAGGFTAACAVVAALKRAKSTDTENAHRRHGGHGVRHAQGEDDHSQAGPPGAAGDVPLPDQEGTEGRVGPARARARDSRRASCPCRSAIAAEPEARSP